MRFGGIFGYVNGCMQFRTIAHRNFIFVLLVIVADKTGLSKCADGQQAGKDCKGKTVHVLTGIFSNFNNVDQKSTSKNDYSF